MSTHTTQHSSWYIMFSKYLLNKKKLGKLKKKKEVKWQLNRNVTVGWRQNEYLYGKETKIYVICVLERNQSKHWYWFKWYSRAGALMRWNDWSNLSRVWIRKSAVLRLIHGIINDVILGLESLTRSKIKKLIHGLS